MNIQTEDQRVEGIAINLDEPVAESRGRKLQYIDLENQYVVDSLKETLGNEGWTSVYKLSSERESISELRQVAKRYNNRGVLFKGLKIYFIVQIIGVDVVLFATLSQPDSWEEVRKKYRV